MLRATARLAACLVLLAPAAAPAPAHAIGYDDEGPAPPSILVGLLTRQWDRACHSMREPTWTNAHLEVGFVRLVDPPPNADLLAGRPVLAQGDPDPEFQGPQVLHTGPCPEEQMRSDWLVSKDGMRLRREPGAPFRAWRADQVRALEGVSVRLDGDEVELRFPQPVGPHLSDLTVRAWYEGCYPKPDVARRETAFMRVAKGEVVTARFPARLLAPERPEGRRNHRLHSIQLLSGDPRVVFDLDLPVEGSRVSCE